MKLMCMNDIDICRFLVIIVGVYQLFTSCKNCTDPSYGLQGPWFLMLYAPFMQLRLFSFSGVSNDHLAVNTFNLIYMMPGHTHIRDCGERSDQTHEASVLSALLVQLDGRSMSLESGRYMETVGWMSTSVTLCWPGLTQVFPSRCPAWWWPE